ncbi:MAG: thermonuclease family protein [Nitrosarchaeum sp.]
MIETKIPDWIRNNALWWSDGQISDGEFISGIQFLINEKIIQISAQSKSIEPTIPFVPNWIKDTAGWWGTNKVTDNDFINGIKWLIENGILIVSTSSTTQCIGNELCITAKVEKIVDGDTIYIKGYKVRLSLTNTPEKDEVGFSQATDFTKNLCPVGSTVIVDQDDKQPYDKYDRLVGKVYCNGKLLNLELLYNDHANILTQYCSKSEFAKETWAKDYGCN